MPATSDAVLRTAMRGPANFLCAAVSKRARPWTKRSRSRMLAPRRIASREYLSICLPHPGFVHLHVHSSYSLLEGALTDRAAGGARQKRPPAGAGADRHRQHVRRARILRKDGERRHPADHRLRARRSTSATRTTAAAAVGEGLPRIVLLAAREDGYRSLMRLCSRAYLDTAPTERPHIKLRLARRGGGRPDRAQRRSQRPARCRDRRRPERARASALRGVAAPVRRPALYRVAAPRHAGRAGGGAGA